MNPTGGTKRPSAVTLLALGVLLLAVLNLARALQTGRLWNVLEESLSVQPVYLLVTGLVWGVWGAALAWMLWRGRRAAPRWALISLVVYSLYAWLDRGLLSFSQFRSTRALFWVGVNLLVFAVSLAVFRSRKARAFFGEMNEPTSRTELANHSPGGDPRGAAGEDPPTA